MTDPTRDDLVPPEVEAHFQRLAGLISQDDWQKLIAGTTDAVLKRLAGCGAMDGATPESLEAAYKTIGQLLVDYTNVILTSVAQADWDAGGRA
ncbi:MAG: hypothetical protein VKN33_02370 [Candidatus Sericytochromatia bacterium]|nr:hypothetical protein [Candidatus Sericytochromatia bacterium]